MNWAISTYKKCYPSLVLCSVLKDPIYLLVQHQVGQCQLQPNHLVLVPASASYNSTPLPPKLLVVTKSNRKGKSKKCNHDDVITFDSNTEEQTKQKKSKDKSSLKTIESKMDDMKEDMELKAEICAREFAAINVYHMTLYIIVCRQ